MKHALLLATFTVATVISVAQQPANILPNPGSVPVPMRITSSDIVPQADVKASESTQALGWTRLFGTDVRAQFHYWPYGTVSNDCFKYDAKTNSINIARNKATFTGTNIGGVELGIVRSTDNGSSWGFDVIKKTNEQFFGMPSFAWVNPNEATDPLVLPAMIYGIRYPMPALSYGGLAMWVRTTNGTFDLSLSDQTPPATGYTISLGGSLYAEKQGTAVHWAGTLDPDAIRQYGLYGYFNFDLAVEDFGQSATSPSAWGLDKWRPSELIASSYNAPVLIEGDEAGSLYACFNNFKSEELEARGVQVSKSTDQGKTWGTSLNTMPLTLLDQFATQHGGDIGFQPGTSPYSGGDFIVTGSNEYSFFFRLATGIANATDPNQIDSLLAYHIVEAKFKGGAWSLNAVAELQSISHRMCSIVDSISTAIGAPGITVEDNGRGHEIQAAITADGATLIVKYVDINPARNNEFPAVRVFISQNTNNVITYTEGDPITSMMDTDLFITMRELNSNTWADPKNMTDDEDMAYRTYMTDVVPSKTNIPVIRMLGITTGSVSSILPKSIAQIVFNGGASIEYANGGTTSVAEEKTYTFRFNAVAPNPVSSVAEVTFTLDRPATVSVELYDMLGSKLHTIMTQNLVSGLHGVNVDASALAAGTYNVALVVDGVRIMKPFVVIR